MDELSLLEADSIEAVQAAESAIPTLPVPDFTGSLDYIDSLASRSALAVSRRDLAKITTAASTFDYLSPLTFSSKAVPSPTDVGFRVSTDFRPLGDARRFDPEVSVRPPRALVRSSSRVVSSRVFLRSAFPPGWRNPLDPDRDLDDLNRTMADIERRQFRHPFARRFERPDQVVICLKRRIRRQLMHAMGFAGSHYIRKPTFNYWSRVIC